MSDIDQRHVTRPDSPVKKPEAGAILRLPPDCKSCEVIAHGFRNPYDFDFNADGEIFTYDSDVEADYFLPWYSPTRLYHVAYGGHHGWRLAGYMRSWAQAGLLSRYGRYSLSDRPRFADRRGLLPARPVPGALPRRRLRLRLDVRQGLLLPAHAGRGDLQDEAGGLSWRRSAPSGFDPTDIVVAPDGSLFVSMGGRKTRGAVYRIEYVGDGKTPVQRAAGAEDGPR